jgi:hypothetical protein
VVKVLPIISLHYICAPLLNSDVSIEGKVHGSVQRVSVSLRLSLTICYPSGADPGSAAERMRGDRLANGQPFLRVGARAISVGLRSQLSITECGRRAHEIEGGKISRGSDAMWFTDAEGRALGARLS